MTHIELFNKITEDISYQSNDIGNPNFDLLEEGWKKWGIGQKIGWLYKEDYIWYNKEFKYEIKKCKGFDNWILNNIPYQGVLFTLPDFRFSIEETAVVCIYDYPIEKENPTCDWISLNRLLSFEDLYKVYKI
jgi:hypothetical protein